MCCLKAKLIILTTSELPSYLSKTNHDILALSTSSIMSLQIKAIKYLTIENFISRKFFYKKSVELSKDFFKWITISDNFLASKDKHIVYKPNAFWLIHRILNYFYIKLLTDEIIKTYKEVHFICKKKPEDWYPMKCGYNNLSFNPNEDGLDGLISILFHIFQKKSYEIIFEKNFKKSFYKDYFFSVFNRSQNILKRYVKKFFSIRYNKKSNIGFMQGGYDVDYLINENKNIRFINLKKIIEKKLSVAPKTQFKISPLIKNMNDNFFLKWFDDFGKDLSNSFGKQLSFLTLCSPEISKHIDVILNTYKIKNVLFSIGVQNQIEYIFAVKAIALNINLHVFKHAGIEALFFTPGFLEPYLEKNLFPPRFQYLYSILEEAHYDNMKKVVTRVVGRLDVSNSKKILSNHRNILYCLGPDNLTSFKEMDRITHDNERVEFIVKLSKLALHFNNRLDIKVHPKQKYNQYYFLKIVKTQINKNIKLLIEGTVDRIFSNYGLIILDLLHTRVFTSVLYLDIPIVIYIPEGIKLDKNNINYLEERVYIIRNLTELSNIIERYNNKNLKSKNNKTFNRLFLNYPSKQVLFKDILR